MTDQQKLFVDAYFLCNCNATKAAERAGYKSPNVLGARLKTLPEVAAAIKKRLDEHAMPANEVLARLADHARSDMADFWDFGRDETEDERELSRQFPRANIASPTEPTLDLRKAVREGKTHLIKSMERGEWGWKVALVDSQSALNTLARHHKLLTDKVEHDFSKMSDAEVVAIVKEAQGLASTDDDDEQPGDAGDDEAG